MVPFAERRIKIMRKKRLIKSGLRVIFLLILGLILGCIQPELVYAGRDKDISVLTEEAERKETADSWDGTADVNWYDEGMAEFNLSTAEQLAGLAELVNAGNTLADKTINVVNDVCLNDAEYTYEWTPIGACDADGNKYFEGSFNGNAYNIYNIRTTEDAQGGLFGCIGENGIVKAVNIVDGTLYSGGCIANINQGIIAFCNNHSYVEGNDIGGICNVNYNLMYGCKNYGEVLGYFAGSIVGQNAQTTAVVSQCSNWGTVEGRYIAGIIHDNDGWVYNCYNRGTVSGTGSSGGVAGIVYTNGACAVENCYSVGTISYPKNAWIGVDYFVGAICCEDYYSKVSNCYSVAVEECIDIANIVPLEEMKSADFLDKLDCQERTVISAWQTDSEQINDGLPITVADSCYEKGLHKWQPELWLDSRQKELELDGTINPYTYTISTYYNESEPIVTVENTSIATVDYDSEKETIYIDLLKSGSTYVTIHFEETENNVSANFILDLKVTIPEKVRIYPFTDVKVDENDWKYRSTNYVYQNNIMSGVDAVTFAPDMLMDRAMFVQILYNMEKTPTVSYKNVFSDVTVENWYCSAVMWAVDKGITSGVGDGLFGSEMGITREQLATLLYGYANMKGQDVSGKESLEVFGDNEKVSDWALEALQWAVDSGIMSGVPQEDGSLNLEPKSTATRVQCATMIYNYCEAYAN